MENDIFDIDLLDDNKSRSNKLADKLYNDQQQKLNELRIKLFNEVYENVISCIQNNHKYLHKNYCIYSLPSNFKGVVLYKELKRCFMKAIIKKLHKENFNINLVDKETVLIKW